MHISVQNIAAKGYQSEHQCRRANGCQHSSGHDPHTKYSTICQLKLAGKEGELDQEASQHPKESHRQGKEEVGRKYCCLAQHWLISVALQESSRLPFCVESHERLHGKYYEQNQ